MDFQERNFERNIEDTKKHIKETNIELLNAANSFAADVLKEKINKLTLKLHKYLDDLKSINPNNPLIAEDAPLIEDRFVVNKDFKLEAGTLDPETNKIIFRSILVKGEKKTDLNIDPGDIEKPHSFVISNGTDENIFLIEDIASIKQLSEESSRSFLGTAAKGIGGLILLGGVGLIAGVLTKKKNTTVLLGIEFTNNHKIACSIKKDSKILKKLQSTLIDKYEY